MIRLGDDWQGTAAVEASRLCAEATGGVVLVAESAAQLARGRLPCRLEPLGARPLRGFDNAIAVYELVWRSDGVSPLPPALANAATGHLVGRAAAIRRGRALLDASRAGGSGALLLVGEAGVGKSRLAAAVAQEAAATGFLVLHGHCDDGLSAPHQPIVEALAPWIADCPDVILTRLVDGGGRELPRLWPQLTERIPSLRPPNTAEPATLRWRLFDAVVGMVRAIAIESPLLLVIDDLQWAEPSSLLLVGHLIRAQIARTAFVMTVRRGETSASPTSLLGEAAASPHFQLLTVDGLSPSEVAEFLTLRVGPDPPAALTERLTRQTAGNPLFLGAVLAHLDELGLLDRPPGNWVTAAELDGVGVPMGARGVIQRRLDRLSYRARRSLDVAAVAGEVFDEMLVGRILASPLNEALEALDEAKGTGLLREQAPGRSAFAHALVRQAVLDELSLTRQSRLHWQIGEEMERLPPDAPRPYSEIAYHYAAGSDVGDAATVVRTSLAAGHEAVGRLAFEDALLHFRTAMNALGRFAAPPELRHQVLVALAEVLNYLTYIDEALPLWLEAAELARKGQNAEDLVAAIGGYSYLVRVRRDPELVRLVDALSDIVPPGISPARARVLAWKAQYDPDAAERAHDLVDQAVAMARRTGEPQTLAVVWNSAVEVAASASDAHAMLRAAQGFFDECGAAGSAEFHFSSWSIRDMGWALLRLGRREEAAEWLRAFSRLATESRQGATISMDLGIQAALARAEGRFADSKRLAAQARDHAGRHNVIAVMGFGSHVIAVRMEEGRTDEVVANLDLLLVEPDDLPAWRSMRAGALADVGDHSRATVELHALTELGRPRVPPDSTMPLAVRYLPEVCRQLGDFDTAKLLLPYIQPWAGQLLIPLAGLSIEGASDRSLGHLYSTLGELDEADAAYTSAAQLERSNGFRPLVARTQYWHARALIERNSPGDRHRSESLLAEVITIADEFGMRRLGTQATELL
jgi:tetratricopeptide (TPR) repeat protein